jgi:Protein of unknown function (DUF3237)
MSDDLSLNTRFLCLAVAELERPATRIGARVIANVIGGTIEGPRLKGTILRSGGDWLTIRADGSMDLDVRSTMQTDDGALIYTHYKGRLVLSPEMVDMTPTERAAVDPSNYYFRTAPLYETDSEKYAWVNKIQAIGVGRITAIGVTYKVYEVL